MSWASEYNKLKKKREEEEAEEQAQGDIAPVKESISGRGFSPTNSIVRFGNTDAHKAWLGGAADRLAQQRFTSKFLENGGQTNSRGERYWKDDRGNTFWEDGTAVSREGISFFVDAQGRHVTEDGYLLDENGRMTDKKVDSVPSIPGADEIGAPTLPQGATQNQVSSHAMSGNNNNAWFKNPFDDNGWQFSDVPKAILGTIGDVGVNVIEGFSRGIEGVIDLGFYAGAMGQKWQGNDEMYEALKSMGQVDSTSGLFGGMEDKVDEWSLLGDKADYVPNALGQILLMAATSGASSAAGAGQIGATAVTTGTSFASSTGQGITEGYEQGADDATAWKYGAMKGAVDAGSELVFGGLGKGINALGYGKGLTSIDDAFAKKLSSKISNQFWKNAVEYGVKAGAEGTEEVLAGFGTAAAKKLSGLSEEEYWQLVHDEELLDQFVVGLVSSGFAQAGDFANANKNKTDFITDLTANEQKVIDQVYENTITEMEQDGSKLTEREKKAIYDQIVEGLDKGYISIEDIENTLGDKTTLDSLQKESEEYDSLYNTESGKLSEKQKDRLAELKEKNSTIPYADALEKSRTEFSENVFNMLRGERNGMGSKLLESYNERARRGAAYEADLSKYDTKQQAVIQKAIDSGILNNTNRTHEFVDMIAKISADKGVLFDFTNNQKLKESGFALKGKTINGYVTKDGITVNIQSTKALNSIVGHEITHVLEGTEFYTELQNSIVEYAKNKGDYQGRYDALSKLYSGVKDANIDEELTADLVGDYLFTDRDFVKRLSTQNRNVFQKIWDEIKYLCSVATAGSKEARELERVKKAFEDAYRAETKNTAADGGVQYKLSDIEIVRKFIDYADTESANIAIDDKVADLVARGKTVVLSLDSISDYTANADWSDKKAVRKLLKEVLEPNLGVTVKFEHDGQSATAYLTRDGINHAVGGPASPRKAAAFEMFNALVKNSEYAFSSENDIHSKNNQKVKGDIGWDTFVAAATVNGDPYPVVFKIRSIDSDVRSQIYEMATKNETGFSHGDGNQETPADAHPNYGTSPISGDNVAQKETDVKSSLSDSDGEQPRKFGSYNVYGKDIALDAPFNASNATVSETESVVPVAENATPTEENSATEAVAPVVNETPVAEDIAPVDVSEMETTTEPVAEDVRLEREKSALAAEFQRKKDELNEMLRDKNIFISNRASELYNELRNLKKGVRASDQLGYLLDTGYEWSSIRSALVNIKHTPGERVNMNSAIESIAREMLNEEYEDLQYDLDDLDAEYEKQVKELEKKSRIPRITRKDLHQSKIDDVKATFAENGLDFDEVLKNAKNLSTFKTVDNTPQRVMEKALGYKAGQVLSDITVNKVAQNETEGIKWLNSFTDRKNGLLAQISKQYNIKPGSKESAAAQMYAEGYYVTGTGKEGEYVKGKSEIIQYGDAELAKDFPDAQVQRNIKGLASDPRIRQIYDDTLAMINESRARNLYPEIPRLDNYFLHFRAMDDTFSRLGLPFNPNDIRAKDLPTDLNGVTADLKPGQPYFASAMHRKGKRTSFDLLGGLEKYLSSAKNQIFHIDDIQNLRALRNYIADTYGQANGLNDLDSLSEEEAQERIKDVYNSHLSTFAKFLNEEANILAGKTALIDRGLEGVIGRRGITFLDTVNRQVGSNMVGFNVSSSLTNFISVAQAFAKTNKADFVKAFGQTVGNKVGSMFGRSDSFTENSPVVIRRKGADRFYRTPFQKAGDAGYALMSAVDNISTELIARTKYNELTRKGMDSQQAHFETDKWVSKLMGDRSLGQMPQLYNSKLVNLFTKFQLEVRNQLDSQFYDTIQETKASNEDIQNGLAKNAKTAAKVTSTFVQLAVAQHLFGKAFESVAGYNPAFDIISVVMKAFGWDDEEDSEDTVLDNIDQAFMELLGDLPYTSTFTGGRIPISSALPIEQLIMGEDEYGNEKPWWETLAEIAPYYVLPGGYGQLKKTWQGLSMFSDDHPIAGSYTDSGNLRFPVEDTFGSKLQAGIFGQWASSNSQDYFDNERSPLTEKQIQEFMEVDMTIQEYWEYREGLKGLKTLAEKAEYIDSLDLSDDQKNILISNLVDDSPEKQVVAKAIADDLLTYYRYRGELHEIEADKDEDGKSISGSRKQKVADYINGLNADYGQKIILWKSEYPSDDTYNYDIIDYLNSRDDISYDEMETILKELGFTVHSDGSVTWD